MSTGKITAYSMTAVDVHQSMHRSGLMFMPSFEHPFFPLAMIAHGVRGGALYHSATALQPVGRHFDDGFLWEHLSAVMSFYKFPVKTPEIDMRWASMISFCLALRALFGAEAAFRFWLAIFDECFSDLSVKFDAKEPTAALTYAEDSSKGFDAWVPGYDRWVAFALESAVDSSKAQQWMHYSAGMPQESFLRKATEGFVRLSYEAPARYSRHQRRGSMGEALPELRGSVPQEYINRSAAIYAEPTQTKGGYVPPSKSIADGGLYAAEQIDLYTKPIGQPGVYPLEGYGVSQLNELSPIQRFGYVRRDTGKHTGLDLPAPKGTGVLALYPGTIKHVQPTPQGAAGIFVVVEHTFKSGTTHYKGSTEYYHLSEVADDLEVGKAVKAGERLGAVGSTGNSTGPHLHLTVRVAELDSMGRSAIKRVVDPEVAIRRGLVDAAREQGFSFGSAGKPVLSPAAAVMSGILEGRSYNPGIGTPDYEAFMAQTRAIFERTTQAAAAAVSAASAAASKVTKAAEPVARKGFELFEPGSKGRATLEAAYSSFGLPGGLAGQVLDAIKAGYDQAADGADPKEVLQATLKGLGEGGVDRAALDFAARYVASEIIPTE